MTLRLPAAACLLVLAPLAAASDTWVQMARGHFEVNIDQEATDEGLTPLARAAMRKTFHGELEGSAEGTMLSAVSPTQGSAGYVALERIVGRLHGRSGSFVLQHHGLMDRGEQKHEMVIVPDSGDGELVGIRGRMHLDRSAGRHDYVLEYSLPAAADRN